MLNLLSEYHNIKSEYGGGWLKMYPFFITIGMILAVLASYFKISKRKLAFEPFMLSAVVIITASLFGASFLGKLDFDPEKPAMNFVEFWHLFAFWQGGMSIHGGVLFGCVAGIIFYYFARKKDRVSIWVYGDCIIPNILLGQAVGRWGNFFNHEILGSRVSRSSLNWLPDWIADNSFKVLGGPKSITAETNALGEIIYHQPIFLYESFFLLLAWIIITLVLPNLGKWIGPKPWKKDPQQYPFSLKYSFIRCFNWKYRLENKITWTEAWNQAYYNVDLTDEQQKQVSAVNVDNSKYQKVGLKRFQLDIKRSKLLYQFHNKDKYWITRVGVQMGAYFFFWNIIRFTMETQREEDSELFIINNRPADYTLILLTAFIGLAIAIISQFIATRYFRKNKWLFEKEYK